MENVRTRRVMIQSQGVPPEIELLTVPTPSPLRGSRHELHRTRCRRANRMALVAHIPPMTTNSRLIGGPRIPSSRD